MAKYNCEPIITRAHWINLKSQGQIDMNSMYSVYLMRCNHRQDFRLTFDEFTSRIARFVNHGIFREKILNTTNMILDEYFEISILSQGREIIGIW